MFYSAKGKARHTCWLPFSPSSCRYKHHLRILASAGREESINLSVRDRGIRPSILSERSVILTSLLWVIRETVIGMLSPGGPSKSHNTIDVRRASWLTTLILSPVGASTAFTLRVYPAARHKLGLFRLKIQEGRW